MKKGAMFGLDARITLTIFAALGLIAFTNFYFVSRQATATQYYSEADAVGQALKNFKLDTNYQLSVNTNPYYYNIAELITLTQDANKPYTKKYKGPYLDYKTTADDYIIENPNNGLQISLVSRSLTNFASGNSENTKCSGDNCFIFIKLYNVPTSIYDEMAIIGKDIEYKNVSTDLRNVYLPLMAE
ncbi:MAG: hypothetical protein CFH44_00700 [Proteobacteria bacterium]|nr:MAG: hypothetical protein CFH44_00700 [Pseudomonadota bacterium]